MFPPKLSSHTLSHGVGGTQGERVSATAEAKAFAATLQCCLAAQLETSTVLETMGQPTLVRLKLQPLDADGRVVASSTERSHAQVGANTRHSERVTVGEAQ
jgi:hypothetical protein